MLCFFFNKKYHKSRFLVKIIRYSNVYLKCLVVELLLFVIFNDFKRFNFIKNQNIKCFDVKKNNEQRSLLHLRNMIKKYKNHDCKQAQYKLFNIKKKLI